MAQARESVPRSMEDNPRVAYVRRDTFFLDAENYYYDEDQERYAMTYEQALELNNALRAALDLVT